MKKDFWPALADGLLILAGAALQAVALRLFLIPAELASGGVSGIAQLINHYTGWPIGVMVLIGNLPLFLLGWRFLGGTRFVWRTALAVLAYSLLVDLLARVLPAAGLTDDIFLNTLYGALVSGAGYGLVYRAQGTSGGSDILARILHHWRSVPMTQSYLLVDSAVILAAGFVFGPKQALYALVALYVSGLAADSVLQGGRTARTALIITARPREVAAGILTEMERGVTLLPGTGAYTGAERPVLYVVVTRPEVALLKSLVHDADPAAFMVIGQAYEALGEGFQALKKE